MPRSRLLVMMATRRFHRARLDSLRTALHAPGRINGAETLAALDEAPEIAVLVDANGPRATDLVFDLGRRRRGLKPVTPTSFSLRSRGDEAATGRIGSAADQAHGRAHGSC